MKAPIPDEFCSPAFCHVTINLLTYQRYCNLVKKCSKYKNKWLYCNNKHKIDSNNCSTKNIETIMPTSNLLSIPQQFANNAQNKGRI